MDLRVICEVESAEAGVAEEGTALRLGHGNADYRLGRAGRVDGRRLLLQDGYSEDSVQEPLGDWGPRCGVESFCELFPFADVAYIFDDAEVDG